MGRSCQRTRDRMDNGVNREAPAHGSRRMHEYVWQERCGTAKKSARLMGNILIMFSLLPIRSGQRGMLYAAHHAPN